MPLIAIAASDPRVRKQVMRIDWLWLIIGIVAALFVFPMISAWWANRSAKSQ